MAVRDVVQAAAGNAGGAPYWISLLGGTGNDYGQGVAVDSSDNIILMGYTNSDGAGGTDFLIAKYDSFGTLQWSKTLGGTGSETGYNVAIDSSDNIIAVGYTNSGGAGGYDFLVAKYNSSGILQWSKTLGSTSNELAEDVVIDSSDNIIVVGSTNLGGAYNALVVKYDSSGTLLWNKRLGFTSSDQFRGVAVDTSDNIIAVGYTQSDGVGLTDFLVVKYNSSGTLLWKKTLGGSNYDRGQNVATDSSNNIIVVGYTQSKTPTDPDLLIAKYNSSGTLLWSKTLGGSNYDIGDGVTIDSSDNIIAVGYTNSNGAGGYDFLVAKYDSSGTLLWDKTLGGAGVDYCVDVALDSSDNIIAVGYTSSDGAGAYDCIVAKLPSDGSGSGTYGSFVYQDAVLTDAAIVLTDRLSVLSESSTVLTNASAVLTDAVAVLTDEFFPITP